MALAVAVPSALATAAPGLPGDLSVKIHARKTTRPGKTIQLGLTVKNLGPTAVQNVVVIGNIPDPDEFVAGSLNCGAGGTPSEGGQYQCTYAQLGPNARVHITALVRICCLGQGEVEVHHSAEVGPFEPDPNKSNNTSVTITRIV